MIGFLIGNIEEIFNDRLIINVNDVGYVVIVAMKYMQKLNIGDKIRIFIHSVFREDKIELFGFFSRIEQDFFYSLIKIHGISARLAINIIGVTEPEKIIQAVVSCDQKFLSTISGVGKKLALRIINELKIDDLSIANSVEESSVEQDAIKALVKLGYSPQLAQKTVISFYKKDISIDELIRKSLAAIS